MAFFQLGRKLDIAKEYSLEEIPVFSSLTPSEQKLIEKKARLLEYKRGDIVYEEGTPAEGFYAVISGRFRLFTKSRTNSAGQTLIYFYRGDHFGETSLLTGQPHSATVEAKRDGVILKLDKDDFLKLVNDIPTISVHLSRSLGHRLTKNEDATVRREVKIAALYSKSASAAVYQCWLDFAGGLHQETKRKVVLVDFVSSIHSVFKEEFQSAYMPHFNLAAMDPSRESDLKACLVQHPQGFHYIHVPTEEMQDKDDRKISVLLTFLTYRYNYLLLRLPAEINHVVFKVLKQSDYVYVHAGPRSTQLAEITQVLAEFQQGFGFGKNEIRVIVPEDRDKDSLPLSEKEQILGMKIFSLLPSRIHQPDRYQSTLRYFAKELAGTLLGLALGSGAAYGLAHIGVLRVLEREGISVDVISGSSIGALIGALWAAGYSADDLEGIAKSIDKKNGFFKLLGFRDLSIAHRGFFKGNQVTRFLESFLGNQTFQDLKIPVKVIAANLFTSEEVVFESGRVVDAVRASVSIPGIFRPVFHEGQYLIDGGVIDPLPVRVLAKMGVKKIIGVNVLSGPEDFLERNRLAEESRRRWIESLERKNIFGKMLAQFLHKVHDRYAVNIFNVIMSSIQFMEYEIAESWGNQADVLIHPIVHEGHWAEFYSPDKFIKMGEEKTREQLFEIKGLLVE